MITRPHHRSGAAAAGEQFAAQEGQHANQSGTARPRGRATRSTFLRRFHRFFRFTNSWLPAALRLAMAPARSTTGGPGAGAIEVRAARRCRPDDARADRRACDRGDRAQGRRSRRPARPSQPRAAHPRLHHRHGRPVRLDVRRHAHADQAGASRALVRCSGARPWRGRRPRHRAARCRSAYFRRDFHQPDRSARARPSSADELLPDLAS